MAELIIQPQMRKALIWVCEMSDTVKDRSRNA